MAKGERIRSVLWAEMTLKDLYYFAETATEGSITRAAARLFIAQPALSQCIHKLEKELGITLFNRTGTGVELTGEGECFLTFARHVLRERAALDRQLQDVKNADAGRIRLGFTGTQATYVLPYVLPDFQEKHPNVEISLIEATSDEIEKKLLEHEVDIGILHLPVLHNGLHYFVLSQDEMVIIPRSNSRFQKYIYYTGEGTRPYLQPEFLRDEPLILTPPSQRSRMVCDQMLANAGIVPQIRQTSRNLSTLDALAQVNYASTIMPCKQISQELKRRGYFFFPKENAVPYSFVVAVAADAYLSVATRYMMEEFRIKKDTF